MESKFDMNPSGSTTYWRDDPTRVIALALWPRTVSVGFTLPALARLWQQETVETEREIAPPQSPNAQPPFPVIPRNDSNG